VPRLLAAALALVVLAGCGPTDSELRRAVLEDAVARTVDGTLAFNLTVDADEDALSGFDGAAGPLAALLAGSSAAGVIEADRLAVGLALAGADLAQVRVTAPGEQFVRFNLGALAQLTTGSSEAATGRLEAALAEAGLEPAARGAVLAAARGEWVRLDAGGTDAGGTDDGLRPTATSVREALAALLLAAEPVDHDGALDQQPFDGRLDVEVDVERALAVAAQALAGIAPSAVPTQTEVDEPLPGRIHVRNGVIRSVVLELGALAEQEGSIELELDLRTLEDAEPLVEAPEVAATVTLDELERAADALARLQADPAP